MANNLLVLCCFIFLIISCSSEIEKNKLSFDVPIKQVEDSMVKLNQIMDKLPPEDSSTFFKNCFIENGNLFVNNRDLGIIDSVNIQKVDLFDKLTPHEKESLRTIIKFLKANKITSGFTEAKSCYLYTYKYNVKDSYYTTRTIVIKDLSCDYLFSRYEVIDSSGSMLLIKAIH